MYRSIPCNFGSIVFKSKEYDAVFLVILKLFLTPSLIPRIFILALIGPEIVVQSSGGRHDSFQPCTFNWLNTSVGISVKLLTVIIYCHQLVYGI